MSVIMLLCQNFLYFHTYLFFVYSFLFFYSIDAKNEKITSFTLFYIYFIVYTSFHLRKYMLSIFSIHTHSYI